MLDLRLTLILASQSPRRRQLLQRLGLAFDVVPSDASEDLDESIAPAGAVEMLALRKAAVVSHRHPDALVLGADTIVVLDGDVLGKPASGDEAAAMLRRLSGRTHTVYTGIALLHHASGRTVAAHEATEVTFAPLAPWEIEAYVATGSPMDKAGGYGIQDDLGALLIAGVRGDYYNVVGLPLRRLYVTLREHFADVLAGAAAFSADPP
jgi:septum formation protein